MMMFLVVVVVRSFVLLLLLRPSPPAGTCRTNADRRLTSLLIDRPIDLPHTSSCYHHLDAILLLLHTTVPRCLCRRGLPGLAGLLAAPLGLGRTNGPPSSHPSIHPTRPNLTPGPPGVARGQCRQAGRQVGRQAVRTARLLT
ncbi:hypothetical protein GGR56DRAFT_649844 [Xylariaceae sp. FL0804]|nr:hypothetical protein GGR56DRAFT_649844 [Xylariaceae sp. FL0804]